MPHERIGPFERPPEAAAKRSTSANLATILKEYAFDDKDSLRALFVELSSINAINAEPRSRSSSVSSNKTDLYITEDSTAASSCFDESKYKLLEEDDSIDLSFATKLADRENQAFVMERCSTVVVTRRMKLAIKSWLDGHTPHVLWIEDRDPTELPSRNTAVAVALSSVLSSMGVPCISHFCSQMKQTSSMDDFYHSSLLALIVDLCEQLGKIIATSPAIPGPTQDSIRERLKRFEADPASIPLAKDLLAQLIDARPQRLICILDNVNILEDLGRPEHHRQQQEIVDILVRGAISRVEPNGDMYRVCFTTDGFFGTLADHVHDDKVEHFLHDRDIGAEDNIALNEWQEVPE